MSNTPSTSSDPVWTLLLLIGTIFFIALLIWWMFRVPFLEVLRYLRLSELWIIGLFTNEQAACFAWLKQAPIGAAIVPSALEIRMAQSCFSDVNLYALNPEDALNYYQLTGTSIGVIGHHVARYMRIPLAVIFTLIAYYTIFISPRTKFRMRHTLESFIKVQSKMWPVISPIVNFKPATLSARIPGSTVPDKLPPFAEALSPEEWISWNRIAVTNGIPDREAARRAFIQQLGPRWQGIEGQPGYIRALFAAFALKGVQRRDESDDLLGRLATCWTIEKGLRVTPEIIAEVDKHIRDKDVGGEALKIANQYAYRTTAMLGVLKWSRWMGGVLASAHFLWLRAVDRALWYPMNCLGRRSFHVEGSGAMAHFMAEENAKKPLLIPRVDTAIVALNQFLSDPEKPTIPIPPREDAPAST